jgi:tripartite-type tricarboxylate transporter receptor subunit TctC
MTLFARLSYDLRKDLVAINRVAGYPSAIVLHPALPARSVKDLIALARKRPGELNFGSPGPGSPNRLAIELFMIMSKTKMVHVPYKGGSGQMVVDLLAGHVQVASIGLPPSMAYIKAGRLRAIAVTSTRRSPLLPDVPTVSEAGLPGFDVTSWYGVFAPAALPKNLVAKVNGDVAAILDTPDMKQRLDKLGADPAPMSPEEFAKFVGAEVEKWGKVVKASGAKVD